VSYKVHLVRFVLPASIFLMFCPLALFVLAACSLSVLSTPAVPNGLHARQDVQNVVYVTDLDFFCMIMPRDPHTNIGDSKHPGGMKTYCSSHGRYSSQQGQLPVDFWNGVEFETGGGSNGGRFAQLTGCINPATLSRLNPADAGGQYDSSGGVDGQGIPQGSICLGYNHYVEVVEPARSRACIKCCDDPADCPTNMDTKGCPNVIPGDYFYCA